MNIIILDEADKDFDDIYNYIASFSEERAGKYIDMLKDYISLLEANPYLGKPYKDFRVLTKKSHLIYYIVDELKQVIYIATIRHNALQIFQ